MPRWLANLVRRRIRVNCHDSLRSRSCSCVSITLPGLPGKGAEALEHIRDDDATRTRCQEYETTAPTWAGDGGFD
jgi:hypothetical protein